MLALTHTTPFPRPNKKLHVIMCINYTPDLPSTAQDGRHVTKLVTSWLHADHIHVIVSDKQLLTKYATEYTSLKNITFYNPNFKIDLLTTMTTIVTSLNDCDLLFTISSHGYAVGHNNYIKYGGATVTDMDLHKSIVCGLKSCVYTLACIDTCQSGTMLKLSHQIRTPNDLQSHKVQGCNNVMEEPLNIVCISAVLDEQMDGDDISDEGFDGGLTAGVIDYYESLGNKTIGGLYTYYANRITPTGNSSILSYTNTHFVDNDRDSKV
jgi:hypothetical protein